jgi:CRP/FNR family cyclic AMP-dependent transcriptional regulator
VHWAVRAGQVAAVAADAEQGTATLAMLWAGGRGAFDAAALHRLAGYLQFVRVRAGQRLILQDEPGDFMLIVLDGTLAVEHLTGSARPARLAEARPGDVLGEMALLDAGPRASDCTTRTPCVLAVMETEALQRLMSDDPKLALVLLASLARRLSLRLRQVSARLSALLADT